MSLALRYYKIKDSLSLSTRRGEIFSRDSFVVYSTLLWNMASIRPLTPELAEKAKLELNEDPKRLNEDLQHLKDWISKQPHLRARTDDQWLVAFLRGCKFSLERAKEKIDLYYTVRSTVPEFHKYKHKDPKFMEILELGSSLPLPSKYGANPAVAIVAPGKYDAEKYSIADVFGVNNVLQMIMLMENDNAVVAGVQTILDLEGVGFGHVVQMTPGTMKKMVVFGQDATPLRMKGTHYLNTPAGFETVFNAIKSLLNEKNQQRLYVHNKDIEEMYKHIPKDILPVEYGGKAGTIQEIIEYWKKKVEEWSDWLEHEEQYGTDESKRPGKPKTSEEMFGIEGSFRQMQFD